MGSDFDLSGRVAVVAGGAGLIGTALCEALADHSATVVVADAAEDRGQALADELGEETEFVGVDVTDDESVAELVETVRDRHGRIDAFVNCSYPRNENYGQRYEEVAADDWRENVDLHLNSYFVTAHAVSKVMMDQDGGGTIVNFGSTYGVQAPDFSVYEGTEMTSPVEYSAIKGGILNLTRYMASYLGEYGVRVNAVSPGGVFDDQHPEFVDRYEERTPLGRMASPEDFRGPVVFLASEASRYVTGQNLVVDGGWTIR